LKSTELIFNDGEVAGAGLLLPFLSLQIEENEKLKDATQSVTLEPGESAVVKAEFNPDEVCKGDGECQWQGEIDISTAVGGSKKLLLAFDQGKKSVWTGYMVSFGAFPRAAGNNSWDEEPHAGDINVAAYDGNALMNAYSSFMSQNNPSDADIEELFQALGSARKDSWKYGDACGDNCTSCRPSTSGFACIGNGMMPAGPLEMPFQAYLDFSGTVDDPDSKSHVLTSGTLHLPADPAILLVRAENENKGIRNLEEFKLVSVIDGRYRREDSTNMVSCDDGFEVLSVPWLLGVEGDSTCPGGVCSERHFSECRGTTYPWIGSYVERNKNFSVASPVADGSRIKRTLELMKGVIINDDDLVAFYRETVEFLGQSNLQDAVSYGFMVLKDTGAEVDTHDVASFSEPEIDEAEVDVFEERDWCGPAFDRLKELRPDLPTDSLRDSLKGTGDGPQPSVTRDIVNLLISGVEDPVTQPITMTLGCYDADRNRETTTGGKDCDDEDSVMGSRCGATEPLGTCQYDSVASGWSVHYLCEETGLFDERCPVESEVTYFLTKNDFHYDSPHGTLDRGCETNAPADASWHNQVDQYIDSQFTALDLQGNPDCMNHNDTENYDPDDDAYLQGTGCEGDAPPDIIQGMTLPAPATCGATLKNWLESYPLLVKIANWDCLNTVGGADDAVCYQQDDLLAGKKFYQPPNDAPSLTPLNGGNGLVNNAFRYVTQFQSSAVGASGALGFMPGICSPLETTGYCYSPEEITEIAQRNECLLYLFDKNPRGVFTGEDKPHGVNDYLRESLGYSTQAGSYGVVKTQSGFEKLYAELLIMVGDDAITKALSSRFDLAELTMGNFEGSKFEPHGIDLSGLAGGEMRNLYKAAQAFQTVLDRFQRLWVLLSHIKYGASTMENELPQILSAEMATTYLGRVIDAAKKKTRVWSTIGEKYHNFARTDLARRVIERAYIAASFESVLITSVMKQILDLVDKSKQEEIRYKLKIAQIGFSAALTRMLSVYGDLDADLNYFGFTDDYIPFPGLEVGAGRDNGFEVQINRAKERMSWASQKETEAIETSRTFAFDAASFFSELEEIENRYEAQIIEKCGSFKSDDGQVYPAMALYADFLPEQLRTGADPCGSNVMETGAIYEARSQFELAVLELQQNNRALREKIEQVESIMHHLAASCSTIENFNQKLKDVAINKMTIEHQINEANRVNEVVQTVCSGVSAVLGSGLGLAGLLHAANNVAMTTSVAVKNSKIRKAEEDLKGIAETQFKLEGEQQCAMLENEGQKQIRDVLIGMESAMIEIAQGQKRLEIAGQKVESQWQGAQRLILELEEMRELTINKQAARNNPNFRIYRDDSVRNAEIAFKKLLTEAYKSTRVYEYYTSQSYAFMDELYLSRMINYGEYNLQNYIYDLEDAFWEFEDHFGLPELRVLPLSLKEDIFPGMRVEPGGKAFSAREMDDTVLNWLQQSMNEEGVATLSFQIGPQFISPGTRVHKVSYVEACVEQQTAAAAQHPRIYLDMAGTSSVWALGADFTDLFYDFGGRPAVVTARWCSGSDYSWDPKIFQSQKFTQRPLFNTQWDLKINFTTEPANQGYGPEDFDDLKLFFYYQEYTDF
jgi:hypothetical protein